MKLIDLLSVIGTNRSGMPVVDIYRTSEDIRNYIAGIIVSHDTIKFLKPELLDMDVERLTLPDPKEGERQKIRVFVK